VELLVDVEDGLDVVVAGVDVGERAAGIAEGLRIDDESGTGAKVFGVDTEAFR